jgi:hypothetical protein
MIYCKRQGTNWLCPNNDIGSQELAKPVSYWIESPGERKARYQRLAIAAAAAAARVPTPEARAAYLILADTWSSLAKGGEPNDAENISTEPKDRNAQAGPQEPPCGPHPEK